MIEKSGIEMLEEILHRLSIIEQRIDVMDKNIKTVANSAKIADLVNKAAGTSLDTWSKAAKPGVPKDFSAMNENVGAKNFDHGDVKKQIEDIKNKAGFKNFDFEVTDASKLPGAPVPHRGARNELKPKIRNILVKGVLKIEKNDDVVPLSGVSVKIYDTQDQLVKNTKTNRAGHWMSHLPPGKYVALFAGEVAGKKLLSQNKNFEVPEKLPDGQTEFEVI